MLQSIESSTGPLAPLALASYRRVLLQEVDEGHRRHIVLPQALIATLFLPILWVAIPHQKRPWLYRMRWLVAGLGVLVNYEQITRASSINVAWSVISGLMGTFGAMLCFQHIIFTNPQRDAARIIKVPCAGYSDATYHPSGESNAPPHVSATTQRAAGPGQATERRLIQPQYGPSSPTKPHLVPSSSVGAEYCYIWQGFPSQASFLDRLGWATDLVLSFRGAGWSSSISVIPKPDTPHPVKNGHRVCVSSVPSVTNSGFEYLQSPAAFLWHRTNLFTAAYLMLDFLGTFMMKDPYFVFGRDGSVKYALPWYLTGLSPWRLEAYRQLFSITGAFSAVAAGYSLADILHYCFTLYCNPSRNVPWMYASAFGSFGEVFDRGLAGLWGSWWHQTFRQQFLGPATFLLRNGLIRKGTAAGSAVALFSPFAMSGLLHAMGSLSAMPTTKLWSQPAFFLLQAVGILVQYLLALLVQKIAPSPSVIVKRVANFSFAFLWLHATAALFNDDLAAMGLWLLEPVPVSLFRAAGFGFPGDAIWRWDGSYLFRWHSGRHWWESGVAI